MKRIVLMFLVAFFGLVLNAGAGEKANPFDTLRCGMCHKKVSSKTFPSLGDIADAYDGKAEQLHKYLQGEAEPVLRPESGATMQRYIGKTKALSKSERKALVDFLLRH